MARSTGIYSGLQPAMTAWTATNSTVTTPIRGAMSPTTSSGLWLVPLSISATRSGVGGMMGTPMDQPFLKKRSLTSLSVPLNLTLRPGREASSPGPHLALGCHGWPP